MDNCLTSLKQQTKFRASFFGQKKGYTNIFSQCFRLFWTYIHIKCFNYCFLGGMDTKKKAYRGVLGIHSEMEGSALAMDA